MKFADALHRACRSVEALRGMNSAFEPSEEGRQVEGLFESLLAHSFISE